MVTAPYGFQSTNQYAHQIILLKKTLRSQDYKPGAGIHCTDHFAAMKIAVNGDMNASGLSGGVDVEIVQKNRPGMSFEDKSPLLVAYKGDTNAVVIEFPPNQVRSGGEGPNGGYATVSVGLCRFHTKTGVYSRSQFLENYVLPSVGYDERDQIEGEIATARQIEKDQHYESVWGNKVTVPEEKRILNNLEHARNKKKMSYEEWQEMQRKKEMEETEGFLNSSGEREKRDLEEFKDALTELVAADKKHSSEDLEKLKRALKDL